MTKKSARGEFNSFVKGLITEASVLNFPEQAAREIENFELNKDGTLFRRKGFGFEPDYVYIDTLLSEEDVADGLVSEYVWDDPAGQAGEKYLVVQTGDTLRFFNLNVEGISQFGLIGTITLPSTNHALNSSSYAAVDGKLVIATGDQQVYLVTYNTTTESFSISSFRLQSRDLWGISFPPSDANPTARPGYSDQRHLYNLQNQGWNASRRVSPSQFDDPAFRVAYHLGYYPADADTVWSGMITVPDGSTPLETFSFSAYRENLNASSSTSKGTFIIDLLNRGPSRTQAIINNKSAFPESGIAGLTTVADQTTTGASVVAEYAGRVFYAGFGPTINGDVRSPDLSSFIAFSRLVRNTNDFGKCYQEGDPASRDSSEIVDTDGGLIRISGATGIKKLVVAGKNLLVLASNGVWAIEGGSEYGFTASNYKVDKISSFGAVGADSIVTDGSKVFYWSSDSVYVIARSQLGDLEYQSISEPLIESFYEGIQSVPKSQAKGIYDKITKKLRWIYPGNTEFTAGSVTKELVFDIVISAWSVNTIYNLSTTTVHNMFASSPFTTTTVLNEVLVGADEVFAGAEQVTLDKVEVTSELQSIKYIGLVNTGGSIKMTIAWFNDDQFTDWRGVTGTGIDAKAFLMTGAMTAGDSSVHKQTPVMVVHMFRTENSINGDYKLENQSGCLMRTMWDWAVSSNSNKFSPLFQVYRYRRHYIPDTAPGVYDNGFELVSSRNKLRGRGKAVSLYMESEPLKDCKIAGWNLSLNGNAVA